MKSLSVCSTSPIPGVAIKISKEETIRSSWSLASSCVYISRWIFSSTVALRFGASPDSLSDTTTSIRPGIHFTFERKHYTFEWVCKILWREHFGIDNTRKVNLLRNDCFSNDILYSRLHRPCRKCDTAIAPVFLNLCKKVAVIFSRFF